MLEIIFTCLAVWLFFKAIGLTFKITWGAAKIAAILLLIVAIPVFVLCLIFAGGFILLLPLAIIAGAVGLLKSCT